MSKDNWITDPKTGWPIDPTADQACKICNGTGIIVAYPPPSGMCDVLAECFCIPNRDEFSIKATEHMKNEST